MGPMKNVETIVFALALRSRTLSVDIIVYKIDGNRPHRH